MKCFYLKLLVGFKSTSSIPILNDFIQHLIISRLRLESRGNSDLKANVTVSEIVNYRRAAFNRNK